MTNVVTAYQKAGLRRLIEICAYHLYGNTKKTFVSLTILVFFMAMLIWSLVFRLSVFDQIMNLELTHTHLLQELEDKNYELSQIDSLKLDQNIERANERIFPGFPSVAAWLTDLSEASKISQYQFSYQLGDGRNSHLDGVLEVSVTFVLKRLRHTVDNSFGQTMDFLGTLHTDQRHLDVVRTEAKGSGAGMTEITVESIIWVRDIQRIGGLSHAMPTLANVGPGTGGNVIEEFIQ